MKLRGVKIGGISWKSVWKATEIVLGWKETERIGNDCRWF
jgi:hypothetical protein